MRLSIIASIAILYLLLPHFGSAQNWYENQKLVAPDRMADDHFYRIEVFENDLVISGFFHPFDEFGQDSAYRSGAAYFYSKNTSGNWVFNHKVVGDPHRPQLTLGQDLGISGNYAVISTHNDDFDKNEANELNGSGSALIFKKNASGTWIRQQKLTAGNRIEFDLFAWTSAISGTTAILGAPHHDYDQAMGNYLSSSGAVYVFEKDNSETWNQVVKLVASDRQTSDFFGFEIDINDDLIAVGSMHNDTDENGLNPLEKAGAAYIFQKDSTGAWQELQKLVASDRDSMSFFGESISVQKDVIMVGAHRNKTDEFAANPMYRSGAVYVFERNENGTWEEAQKLVPTSRNKGDLFGGAIDVMGDYAVIGASGHAQDENGNDSLNASGATYVFSRNEFGNWVEREKFVPNDRRKSDGFGLWLSMSESDVFIGSSNVFNEIGQDSLYKAGSVYNFQTCIRNYEVEEAECDSFYWPLNDSTFFSSGNYFDTITNGFGCDSIIKLSLDIIAIDPQVVSADYAGLQAVDSLSSYQWWDCDSNKIVTGATDQIFYPTLNGNYSVIIERQGCLDSSECHFIGNVGIERVDEVLFEVYPNPTESSVFVEISKSSNNSMIELFDARGNLVMKKEVGSLSKIELTLPAEAGLYLLRLKEAGGKSSYKRIIKY